METDAGGRSPSPGQQGRRHMDEKKVDEAWKDQVEKEKEAEAGAEPACSEEDELALPPASFFTHVTSIATQVMLSLGEIEHPVTKETRRSLPEAKFGIALLVMLEEKTGGNLTDQEMEYLQQVLTELRMKYVKAADESPINP